MVHVHGACSWCMFMVHVHCATASTYCCMFLCSWCRFMVPVHCAYSTHTHPPTQTRCWELTQRHVVFVFSPMFSNAPCHGTSVRVRFRSTSGTSQEKHQPSFWCLSTLMYYTDTTYPVTNEAGINQTGIPTTTTANGSTTIASATTRTSGTALPSYAFPGHTDAAGNVKFVLMIHGGCTRCTWYTRCTCCICCTWCTCYLLYLLYSLYLLLVVLVVLVILVVLVTVTCCTRCTCYLLYSLYLLLVVLVTCCACCTRCTRYIWLCNFQCPRPNCKKSCLDHFEICSNPCICLYVY